MKITKNKTNNLIIMHNIITKTISHRGFITLLALVMSISLYAQNLVKGTVVDETDLPLIGATVLIKGNSGGTITDIDGNYSINAKKEAPLWFPISDIKHRK